MSTTVILAMVLKALGVSHFYPSPTTGGYVKTYYPSATFSMSLNKPRAPVVSQQLWRIGIICPI